MKIQAQMPDDTDNQDHAAHDGLNGGVNVEDPALSSDLWELVDARPLSG